MGRAAAAEGAEHIRAAISRRGHANIIVATGTSQFQTLNHLIQIPGVDWKKISGFHLDEYIGLPITHGASFRKYLKERVVDKVPIGSFEYVQGDAPDPRAECRRLGQKIQQHPIDAAFIGIGENAHIAFNDPPADFQTTDPYLVVELDEACRRQQLGESWFPTLDSVPKQAISMSVQHILKSAVIICSVPDERKAEAVRNSVEGEVTPDVPGSILQRHPRCSLYLDEPAASLLNRLTIR
jgi:glucosamine-6-phosphate deaminase